MWPAWTPTSPLRGSAAGTPAEPKDASPKNSMTIAMVLAVNCPPHEPAPGQAASSSSRRSSSVIFPAWAAPTPSNTSWMVMSRPLYRPGAMEPP